MADSFSSTTAKVNRPTSRRGKEDDRYSGTSPVSNMNERPTTSNRNRPPSSRGLTTPSRRSTAMMQPPRTASMMAVPAGMSVMDRPITQQGITGMRPASRNQQQRQVLDKRYYEGLIQMKMRELAAETARLTAEIEAQAQQQAAMSVYETRVREVASELTELQATLSDYNLVIDKVNMSTDLQVMEDELRALKEENDQRNIELNQLFLQNQHKESQIQQLEAEIQNERNAADNLITDMPRAERQKYEELKEQKQIVTTQIESLQQQLDMLNSHKSELQDRISGSQIKQDAVRLYHKLMERSARRTALAEEEKNKATPAQEREQLLQRVKEDNAEMSAMERQILQFNESIKKKKEELELVEQDLEESQSDRHQKYKVLKKREEAMEQFLASFEEMKEAELNRMEEQEGKIVIALEQMSRNLLGSGKIPSFDEFAIIKENLSIKQEELEKSKLTVDELNKEQQQLQQNLQKIELLEEKIVTEMESTREKMATMEKDLKIITNLDAIRDEAQANRERLMKKREELQEKKPRVIERMKTLQEKNNELMQQLNENETYTQLNNLEKKLSVLESNNNAIREVIESKRSETDYELQKKKAMDLVNKYNEMLKTSLKKC